jgi:hypothetical protein
MMVAQAHWVAMAQVGKATMVVLVVPVALVVVAVAAVALAEWVSQALGVLVAVLAALAYQ